MTLSDRSPPPMMSVPVGIRLTVLLPAAPADGETDTVVHIANGLVLREQCSVALPDRTRRTILLAIGSGTSGLSATITPSTDAEMPAWLGSVTVTGRSP